MNLSYGARFFYAANLAFFYIHLLPSIGRSISNKCDNMWHCSRYMRQTWLQYYTDTADGQWREFRGSLWLLWICIIITVTVNYTIRRLCKNSPTERKSTLILHLVSRLIFGFIFLFVQHGYHSLIVILIAYTGYYIAKLCKGSDYTVLITWIYALSILLFKESYRIQYHSSFLYLQPLFARAYGGMYGWQLPANFIILRLISFSLDYHKACIQAEKEPLLFSIENCFLDAENEPPDTESVSPGAQMRRKAETSHEEKEKMACPASTPAACPKQLQYLERVDSLDLSDFSFINFTVYMFYAPLYMAGPIITFGDFVKSAKNIELAAQYPVLYCCRWVLCFALMEYMTHSFPLFAVVSSGLFFQLSVAEMAAAAYLTLKLMWLKFLLLWRFFRLWALYDGIAAPENMVRCMSNNYSLEQFWKGWHTSFNKWIVMYLYLPLGGRKNRTISVWAVFFFVSVWHDIELKLLVWGTLNSVFYVLEVLAKRVMRTRTMQALPPTLSHLLCSVSGALYIVILITVNLIGYAVGVDGISNIYTKMVTWEGLQVMLLSLYFLTVGTSLMIYLEEDKDKDRLQCPLKISRSDVELEISKVITE
jgi:protein-cysteine N-palmitoyltransferase HHAT